MDKSVNYFEVLKWASSFLEEKNKDNAIAEYLILEYNQWTKTDLLMNFKTVVPSEIIEQLKRDLDMIMKDYPPQYLIGSCEFYGERFKVSEGTLIPRPETEELVELCLIENDNAKKRVVDIGTGTGAIAISLKLNRENWDISAIDLSKEALNIAKYNAEKLEAKINFFEGNTLEPVINDTFDLIVSNPPYISKNEWQDMDESVRLYEPKMALFAENDGLAIYEKIAEEAVNVLKDDGKIYVEIGYSQAKNVSNIFQHHFPKKRVKVVKDMSGHNRIVKVY